MHVGIALNIGGGLEHSDSKPIALVKSGKITAGSVIFPFRFHGEDAVITVGLSELDMTEEKNG